MTMMVSDAGNELIDSVFYVPLGHDTYFVHQRPYGEQRGVYSI